MKVKELIEILGKMDAEANVMLAQQPGYPFEYSVAGVAVREEFTEDDDEGSGGDPRAYEPGTAANDVFIVEGTQLRYGSKAAWGAARRR